MGNNVGQVVLIACSSVMSVSMMPSNAGGPPKIMTPMFR